MIFQSSWPQHRPYLDAFTRGLIADSVIDAAVARVLRAKFELGLFERPYVDRGQRRVLERPREPSRARARGGAGVDRAAAERARRAAALAATVRSIAVIGDDAMEARLGGYSGPGNAEVSILDGIRAKVGAGTCGRSVCARAGSHHARVRRRPRRAAVVDRGRSRSAGLSAEYFDNNRLEGEPRVRRSRRAGRFRLDAQLARARDSVRLVLGALDRHAHGAAERRRRASASRATTAIACTSTARSSSTTGRSSRTARTSVDGLAAAWHARTTSRLEYFESTGNARVKLVWDAGVTARLAREDRQRGRARAAERRRDRRRRDRGRRVPRSRVARAARTSGGADPRGRGDAASRSSSCSSAAARSRCRGSIVSDAVVDAWYPGEAGGTRSPTCCSAMQPGGPAADHVPDGRRPAAAPLQPQADRPRRRLPRPHGSAAVSRSASA